MLLLLLPPPGKVRTGNRRTQKSKKNAWQRNCHLPLACCNGSHCRVPIARCLLSTVWCLLPVVQCRLPIVYCLAPIVCYRLSGVYCLLSGVGCPLSGGHCPLSNVECLLYIACAPNQFPSLVGATGCRFLSPPLAGIAPAAAVATGLLPVV